MYLFFFNREKKSLALSPNIFKTYFIARRPTSISYIFERKMIILNNNLNPEGGTLKFNNANLAWLAKTPVGLQRERLLM